MFHRVASNSRVAARALTTRRASGSASRRVPSKNTAPNTAPPSASAAVVAAAPIKPRLDPHKAATEWRGRSREEKEITLMSPPRRGMARSSDFQPGQPTPSGSAGLGDKATERTQPLSERSAEKSASRSEPFSERPAEKETERYGPNKNKYGGGRATMFVADEMGTDSAGKSRSTLLSGPQKSGARPGKTGEPISSPRSPPQSSPSRSMSMFNQKDNFEVERRPDYTCVTKHSGGGTTHYLFPAGQDASAKDTQHYLGVHNYHATPEEYMEQVGSKVKGVQLGDIPKEVGGPMLQAAAGNGKSSGVSGKGVHHTSKASIHSASGSGNAPSSRRASAGRDTRSAAQRTGMAHSTAKSSHQSSRTENEARNTQAAFQSTAGRSTGIEVGQTTSSSTSMHGTSAGAHGGNSGGGAMRGNAQTMRSGSDSSGASNSRVTGGSGNISGSSGGRPSASDRAEHKQNRTAATISTDASGRAGASRASGTSSGSADRSMSGSSTSGSGSGSANTSKGSGSGASDKGISHALGGSSLNAGSGHEMHAQTASASAGRSFDGSSGIGQRMSAGTGVGSNQAVSRDMNGHRDTGSGRVPGLQTSMETDADVDAETATISSGSTMSRGTSMGGMRGAMGGSSTTSTQDSSSRQHQSSSGGTHTSAQRNHSVDMTHDKSNINSRLHRDRLRSSPTTSSNDNSRNSGGSTEHSSASRGSSDHSAADMSNRSDMRHGSNTSSNAAGSGMSGMSGGHSSGMNTVSGSSSTRSSSNAAGSGGSGMAGGMRSGSGLSSGSHSGGRPGMTSGNTGDSAATGHGGQSRGFSTGSGFTTNPNPGNPSNLGGSNDTATGTGGSSVMSGASGGGAAGGDASFDGSGNSGMVSRGVGVGRDADLANSSGMSGRVTSDSRQVARDSPMAGSHGGNISGSTGSYTVTSNRGKGSSSNHASRGSTSSSASHHASRTNADSKSTRASSYQSLSDLMEDDSAITGTPATASTKRVNEAPVDGATFMQSFSKDGAGAGRSDHAQRSASSAGATQPMTDGKLRYTGGSQSAVPPTGGGTGAPPSSGRSMADAHVQGMDPHMSTASAQPHGSRGASAAHTATTAAGSSTNRGNASASSQHTQSAAADEFGTPPGSTKGLHHGSSHAHQSTSSTLASQSSHRSASRHEDLPAVAQTTRHDGNTAALNENEYALECNKYKAYFEKGQVWPNDLNRFTPHTPATFGHFTGVPSMLEDKGDVKASYKNGYDKHDERGNPHTVVGEGIFVDSQGFIEVDPHQDSYARKHANERMGAAADAYPDPTDNYREKVRQREQRYAQERERRLEAALHDGDMSKPITNKHYPDASKIDTRAYPELVEKKAARALKEQGQQTRSSSTQPQRGFATKSSSSGDSGRERGTAGSSGRSRSAREEEEELERKLHDGDMGRPITSSHYPDVSKMDTSSRPVHPEMMAARLQQQHQRGQDSQSSQSGRASEKRAQTASTQHSTTSSASAGAANVKNSMHKSSTGSSTTSSGAGTHA